MKEQFHPVPAMLTNVKPDGVISCTDTNPLLAGAPEGLDTVTVYVAPLWPCTKSPTCVLVMVSPAARMVVESVAELAASPPPDTLTEFTWGEVAFAATLTVTVMGG